VDKFSFSMRDPERWEVVVFKHPIERSRNMVKRLVGLPGEEIRIEHGDLWVRRSDSEDWVIPNRSRDVQDEMWKAIDRDDPSLSSWRVQSGGARWKLTKREIEAREDGTVRFLADKPSITNGYSHGYPDAVRQDSTTRFSTKPVGDLRVQADFEALAGCEEFVAIIVEGDFKYRFTFPGPAAESNASPNIEVLSLADGLQLAYVSAEPWKLSAGSTVNIAAQNLDNHLSLEVDGETLCELAIEPVAIQNSFVELDVTGTGADLSDVQVFRDVYYLKGLTSGESTAIAESHYFMMGDNTQASADSREWLAVTYEWKDADGQLQTLTGNYRAQGENPSKGTDLEGNAVQFLRNQWGDRVQLPEGARQVSRIRQPTVPRDLIRGRALAVFWPFKPSMGIWRHSWLN
ncbi:MAG: signal peptidase I, partial [Planctomycetota bacterium]